MKEQTGFAKMLVLMVGLGWVAVRANDGEEDYNIKDAPLAEVYKRVTDAEQGWVYFQKVDADGKPVGNKLHTWYVVSGNAADEFIADHSCGDGFDDCTSQCHDEVFA